MLLKQIAESRAFTRMGDSSSSFYPGGCAFGAYDDKADFERSIPNLIEIDPEQFRRAARYDPILDQCRKFFFDKEHDVLVALDENEGIYYFFSKGY